MVQAFNRLVGARAALALAPFLALTGCQGFWPQAAAPAAAADDTETDASPAPACPAVTRAEAWVNRMPGVGSSSPKMMVVLGIDSEESWMLAPLDMPAAMGLILDLRPGGNSVPGTVAYRQPVPSPLPGRISILCRGKSAATIDGVMIVQ